MRLARSLSVFISLSALASAWGHAQEKCIVPTPNGTAGLDTRLLHVRTSQQWGGAIVNLTPEGSSCQNLVNLGIPPNGDPGREIQVAFYNTEPPLDCWPCNPGCNERWNPTQAGCPCGSQFYSGFEGWLATPTILQSKSQIYNWDNEDGRSNIHVSQNLSIPKSNLIQLDYLVENLESPANPERTLTGRQAFPVAFLEPVLNHAYRYAGSSPWIGAAPEEVIIQQNNPPPPFSTTEPWIAWVDDSGHGVALYAPSEGFHESWQFLSVSAQGTTDTHVLENWVVPNPPVAPQQSMNQRHYVIYGSLDAIRATVYEHENRPWFQDVPITSGFSPSVNTMFRNGITTGCSLPPLPNFCPNDPNSRAQMAVFLIASKNAPGYVPPACTTKPFNDVETADPFCKWIQRAKLDGIMVGGTSEGCTANNFCPTLVVTRGKMAGFLLRAKEPSGYVPPPAQGIFQDVPASDPDAPWIEEIYNRGITGGCSTNPLKYCPADPNTRGQMSVFLTLNFGLN